MSRIEVLKTYKLFIGGQFPRTESGRYYQPISNGQSLGNICLSSRKDLRNAVAAARSAQAKWSGRSAYNRAQILYRIAEVLEGRSAQFVEELTKQGQDRKSAKLEVECSIDRLVYYAGWCDKYMQLYSAVNPVASSHFNFSIPEPTGVVMLFSKEKDGLLGLVTELVAIIAGGNTCVVLASESKPLCAVSFAEVLVTSDLPGGVVNILTGQIDEIMSHASLHKDINALVYCGSDKNKIKKIQEDAVENLKRVFIKDIADYSDVENECPTNINLLQEVKTTWHPIEKNSPAGSGY